MGLKKVEEQLGKKLKLQDYNTPIQHEVESSKRKVTVYLTEAHFEMFNKLCSKEILKQGKPDKSGLICEAIEMLFKSREN